MKDSVVLYSFFLHSHLVPLAELAKLFCRHGFAATILLPHCPVPAFAGNIDAIVDHVSSHYPSISFHRLPPVSTSCDASTDLFVFLMDSIKLNNPNILSFVRSHSETHRVRAMLLDFFCTDALDVAAELGVPSFFFFTCAAGDLDVFLCLPTLVSASELSSKGIGDAPLDFPGLPLMPASDLPRQLMDCESVACKIMLHHFQRLAESDGLLINSFEELEKPTVEALRDGSCVPAGRRMPKVYCIGPMIAERDDCGDTHECIAWLDLQPRGSVVYLCFGTLGAFTSEQIKEIAIGLERSGQTFLWVVRPPAGQTAENVNMLDESAEPDIGELMPEAS